MLVHIKHMKEQALIVKIGGKRANTKVHFESAVCFEDILLIDCCIIDLVEILMKMYVGMLNFGNFSLALITQICILHIHFVF